MTSDAPLLWAAILALVSSVAGAILVNEFSELCPKWAERLVHRALKRMGPPGFDDAALEELEEELQAIVEGRDGKLAKLLTAVWIAICMPTIARNLRGLPPVRVEVATRLSRLLANTWWAVASRARVSLWWIRGWQSRLGARVRGMRRPVDRDQGLIRLRPYLVTEALAVALGFATAAMSEGAPRTLSQWSLVAAGGVAVAIPLWVKTRRMLRHATMI